MAKRIFITATNTDIGKTFVTMRLLRQYASMGYRVGVIKPIETGVETLPSDGTKLLALVRSLNPAMAAITLDDVVPIRFELAAAPYCANAGQSIDLAPVDRAIEKIEACCDILLIEGAGGLYVPIDRDTMMIDLIERCNSKALLVSHCRLGCINDTLLSVKAMRAKSLDFIWTLNCRQEDQSFHKTSEPYFKDNFPDFTIFERDIVKIAEALLL